jgi:hypothetical protein
MTTAAPIVRDVETRKRSAEAESGPIIGGRTVAPRVLRLSRRLEFPTCTEWTR